MTTTTVSKINLVSIAESDDLPPVNTAYFNAARQSCEASRRWFLCRHTWPGGRPGTACGVPAPGRPGGRAGPGAADGRAPRRRQRHHADAAAPPPGGQARRVRHRSRRPGRRHGRGADAGLRPRPGRLPHARHRRDRLHPADADHPALRAGAHRDGHQRHLGRGAARRPGGRGDRFPRQVHAGRRAHRPPAQPDPARPGGAAAGRAGGLARRRGGGRPAPHARARGGDHLPPRAGGRVPRQRHRRSHVAGGPLQPDRGRGPRAGAGDLPQPLPRGAAARCRQGRHSGRRPAEARPARPGRVRPRQDASGDRSAHPGRKRLRADPAGRGDRRVPPREVGRRRLPARARRRRHPPVGPDRRGGGRVRRPDHGAALQGRDVLRRGPGLHPRRERPPFRPGLRGGVLRALPGHPRRRRAEPGGGAAERRAGHGTLGPGPDPAARGHPGRARPDGVARRRPRHAPETVPGIVPGTVGEPGRVCAVDPRPARIADGAGP